MALAIGRSFSGAAWESGRNAPPRQRPTLDDGDQLLSVGDAPFEKSQISGCKPTNRVSILAHMPPDLIRSAEAAAILGMSQSTFNRKAAAGEIVPALTLDGMTAPRLFRRSDIEKLAARLAKAS